MFSRDEILFLFAIFLFGVSLMLVIFKVVNIPQKIVITQQTNKPWQIESIDTMKYSRDQARAGLNNAAYTKGVNQQVQAIAQTGANYIAIDTPYDDEFTPVLSLWVHVARANGLHIWFRGNWSGWEGWFNYPSIDQATHIAKTKQFILEHKDLFEDGDIFTACPECENGYKLNPTDPVQVSNFRQFLISETTMEKQAFASIGKNVQVGYISMNADVAKAVMDKETTQKLGGVVVIDHYVQTPEELASEVSYLAQLSGGKIILGEFGAPIPDLQGTMSDAQQKDWIESALQQLSVQKDLIGVNYWVNEGGSTALWNTDGTPKPAVSVISNFYQSQ